MIILILLLGFTLRLANLLSMKSLWGDEWYSMALSKKPLLQVIQGAIQDVHPPLYPIISHFFSYNEVILRLLSLLAGVGVIFSVYLLGKQLLSEKTGILASLLVAVSPYFLQSSNEIRSYSLLSLLATITVYFYFKKMKFFYGLFSIMLVYCEHYGWFLLISIFIIDLFFGEKDNELSTNY